MEMSFEYLRETVRFFETHGFQVEVQEVSAPPGGQPAYTTVRHFLERPPDERLALSCVRYPNGTETYWLEILQFHGLRTFDTELDSWRHREHGVEFKYYAREDGVGLSVILDLPPP